MYTFQSTTRQATTFMAVFFISIFVFANWSQRDHHHSTGVHFCRKRVIMHSQVLTGKQVTHTGTFCRNSNLSLENTRKTVSGPQSWGTKSGVRPTPLPKSCQIFADNLSARHAISPHEEWLRDELSLPELQPRVLDTKSDVPCPEKAGYRQEDLIC